MIRSLTSVLLGVGLFGTGALFGWYLARTFPTVDSNVVNRPVTAVTTASDAQNLEFRAFDQDLQAGQFGDALARYRRVHERFGPAQSRPFADALMLHAQRLDLSGAKVDAVQLISAYADVNTSDVDAYLVLAAFHSRAGRPASALNAMAQAVRHTQTAAEQRQLIEQFNHMLSQYVTDQYQGPDGQVPLDVLEDLLEILPGHEPLLLELARAAIVVRDFGIATAALEDIDPEGPFALQRDRMIFQIDREIQAGDPFVAEVPLTPMGRHFLVDATLVYDYNEVDVRLILDTGASLTLIRPDLLSELGIGDDDIKVVRQLSTPGGTIDAPIVELDAMAVGRDTIWRVAVAVAHLETQDQVDGLMGMDFLGQYEFEIDQQRNILRLRRR